MKPKSITSRRQAPLLNFLVLCLGIAGTAGTIFFDTAHAGSATWTGLTADSVLNTGTNWTSGGPPTGSGDVATWDGTATGNLALTWTSTFGAGSPGIGTSINITGTQTGSLLICGTSGAFALASITIADSAGAFTFGDSIDPDAIVFRGTNIFTNNSANTATFASNVTFASGAGSARTLAFTGSGNWQVNAPVQIVSGGGGSLAVTKDGAGTLNLAGANNYTGTTTIGQGILAFTNMIPSVSGGLTFGAAAGSTITSALDLSNGSATFNRVSLVQTNSATANTIAIGSGKTLTFNDNVTIGANIHATTTSLTTTGAGTLAVNKSGGTFQVGGATGNTSANSATLNLSDLSTFTANLGNTGIFRVGDNNATAGSFGNPAGGTSMVVLAGSSTITANTVGIGDLSAQNTLQTLRLGSSSNVMNTNTLVVGAKTSNTTVRGNGLLNFNSATGTLQLRAANGTGRTAVDVANHQMFTGSATTSEMDLSGHSSDLLISTLNIGHRSGGDSNVNGTFSFGTGTLDVTSAVIGVRTGRATNTSTGTLNIAGGTSTFGSIAMGDANTEGSTANGTLNLTGGTVTLAGNITRTGGAGTTSATINLKGATLDMGGFNIGSGTNNVTLNAESGTLKNVAAINGTGGLSKTTAGTLILDGTNTYTGDTTVSEGTLSLTSASLADDSTVSIDSGATLNLPHGTTDIVGTLILDGTTYTSGTFNASTPGSFISGSGSIQVGIVEGFANWIDTNYPALLDKTEGGDPDFDGITNLMEYVLNGNPGTSSTNILPAADNSDPTDLIFTFTRREESAADTTQVFQYGTNLTGWIDIAITGTPGAEVTLGTPAGGLQLVTVKVPKSAAVPSGKLFGRLQVTKP